MKGQSRVEGCCEEPETYTDYSSSDVGKEIFETYEDRGRKPQRPFRRLSGTCDLDGNSIPVGNGVGNNLKLLAIHANLVGRAVAKVLNPGTILGSGFLNRVVRVVHHSA